MQYLAHYTPRKVADWLVSYSCLGAPSSVADFCVGDGSLIEASLRRWTGIRPFINDLDPSAINSSSQKFPSAFAMIGDFLDPSFSLHVAKAGFSSFDLVILNPPFSNLGSQRWSPTGSLGFVRCSQAMAFLLSAAQYLNEAGELIAILPGSLLHSETDSCAREVLSRSCKFEVLSEVLSNMFPGVSAKVFAAKISDMKAARICEGIPASAPSGLMGSACAAVVRGSISIKKSERVVASGNEHVIHTTSIRDYRIVETYEITADYSFAKRIRLGNAVLVPRVGRFKKENIGLVKAAISCVLSDCMFAIFCRDEKSATLLHQLIINRFDDFRSLYSGTGAQYLTKMRLISFLSEIAGELIVSSCALDPCRKSDSRDAHTDTWEKV